MSQEGIGEGPWATAILREVYDEDEKGLTYEVKWWNKDPEADERTWQKPDTLEHLDIYNEFLEVSAKPTQFRAPRQFKNHERAISGKKATNC